MTYTTDGSVVLGSDTTGYTVPASGSQTVTFASSDYREVMRFMHFCL